MANTNPKTKHHKPNLNSFFNIKDVVTITASYGTTPSDPDWNPHADVAEPYGKIDIPDVVVATANCGREHLFLDS